MFTMTDTETNIQFCERIAQNDDRPASRRNRKKKTKTMTTNENNGLTQIQNQNIYEINYKNT